MARSVKAERGNGASSNLRVSASSNTAFEVVLKHLTKKEGLPKKEVGPSSELDELALKIISLLLAGYSSSEISQKLNSPLSTIQRRVKVLTNAGYVVPVIHLNFRKFGLRRGLVQFKCKGANIKEAVQKISAIKGVESVGGYLGSLNIIANVMYEDSSEVLDIIAEAQKMDLVNDASWSEEIYSMPI